MPARIWLIVVAACLLSVPVQLRAQHVEEDDTEVLKAVPRTREPTNHPDRSAVAQRIISLTGRFREREKQGKLEENEQLQKTAQSFADYMARTSRYGHKADGATPAERAKKFDYASCIVAENIAYAYDSEGFSTEGLASDFFEGWKASPGHRRNLLDPDVTDTAVAISQSPEHGYFFAVQMFGRPRSKSLQFTIANEAPTSVEYKMGDKTLTLPPGHTRTHQVCRLRDLEFQWPKADGEARVVQPADGDRFVITKEGETLRLRKVREARPD